MAKDDKKLNTKKVDQLLDGIEKQIDDMYKTTYGTGQTNQKLFHKVTTDLDNAVSSIIQSDRGENGYDLSNTTRLYMRVAKNARKGDKNNPILPKENDADGNMFDMFSDSSFMGNIMGTYADTRWVRKIDDEIDMILKYMPILQIALDIKKDNVLSSDSFSKSFLSISKLNSSIEDEQFTANVEALNQSSNFENLCEEIYDDVSKYGEYFLYQVPYAKALSELLNRKKGVSSNPGALFPTSLKEEAIIENGAFGPAFSSLQKAIALDTNASGTIKLCCHRTGILESAVEGIDRVISLKQRVVQSVYESYIHEKENEPISNIHLAKLGNNRSVKDGNLDLDYGGDDGLYNVNDKKETNIKLKVPGCVMRKIPRDEIIPLYIEDICIGYYVINMRNTKVNDDNANIISGFNSITNMMHKGSNRSEIEGDDALKYIASSISQHIDKNFINANQDLSKEIYMILKYNDKYNVPVNTANVDVTFIPPEDIVHIKFKTDPKTHRGISDIWGGIVPAKLWIMLYQTLSIGTVTRGQDRRVYYVKQTIETNVAKSLLNVIQQIKKGNFGIRQMESINNILGLIGKFNDFVIPVGPNGDPPVNFEIMPGQQIDVPSDLMQELKESAVNSTDIPLEVVQSSNSMDFAIRYSMTNSKMLRIILKRQAKCEYYFSKIYTKLYNTTYDDNCDIKVSLPAPAYLTMVNGSQLIDNTKSYINSIAEVEMADSSEEEKTLFIKKMFRYYLPTHVNIGLIDKFKDEIQLELSQKKEEKQDENMGQ